MCEGILEWTKQNLWMTTLKKPEDMVSIFLRLSSANFNWSILEYFEPKILSEKA